MVVFGAAGSLPKTSREFVFVVFGFFCRVCRDERNESIALRFAATPRVLQRYCCSGLCSTFGGAWTCSG